MSTVMNKTKIEWTNYTWNPVTGCLNDCWCCYVRRLEERYGYSRLPQFRAERLQAPRNARPGSKIFVCSTADLFADWIPGSWIKSIIEIASDLPQLTFQFLTKFPKRYHEFVFPENCWLGTTVESQESAERILYLLAFNKNVRFVSFEPLLGQATGTDYQNRWGYNIDWFIIGAFTGDNRVKFQPKRQWIGDLVGVADKYQKPIFMKNNLKEIWQGQLRQEYPVQKAAKQLAEEADDYRHTQAGVHA